ncbi:Uma2 family endonuclease [Streptomyces sp. BR123]|uniref:Uma2 family endonuclease n=1 Tax=Streptomyces sp. BR123 TaxID=2749828 RepID=UPI0015C4B3CE|nr:Uma2 family endonuclease [Streptomyces sp. BR123]NXY97009.1 Uma2 family endonuclease [Streptomyces sp. BR123]
MSARSTRRPQMTLDDFEALERGAPETVTLEFIAGKLEVKPVPDGDHGAIVMWLLRQCMQSRPELDLHPEQGLTVEQYRTGRARPDGVLAPVAHFAGQGEWPDAAGVLMVVEVTSHDADTDRRDRHEKRDGYAAAGIPVFLLIDRERHTLTVYSQPENGTYLFDPAFAYGKAVVLPDPVGITLDTELLKSITD